MKTRYFSVLLLMLFLAFGGRLSAQTQDTTVTIKVSGITCVMDLPIICKRVKEEKGVKECKADGKAAAVTKFDVTYDLKEISYQQIVNAVQDAPSCDYPKERPFKVKKRKHK